jgi:peptidoglycan/LPS O-acetylase OafA/YrhL
VFAIALDFTRPIWFLVFLSAVIGIAIPTYYGFELPAQNFFRRKLLVYEPARSKFSTVTNLQK